MYISRGLYDILQLQTRQAISIMDIKFIFFFTLLALAFAEDAKKVEEKKSEDKAKPKRGLVGLGYGFNDLAFAAPAYTAQTYGLSPAFTSYHLSEPSTHTHTVITKEVPVPYPQVVEKHVPYPVKVPYAVPVDRPYAVHVPKPYPVEVTKHVPVPVDRPVPYAVKVPVKVAVPAPYPVKVPEPYAVPVVKHVGVPYPQPIVVEKYQQPLVLEKYQSYSHGWN